MRARKKFVSRFSGGIVPGRLENKVAVITGASAGIGQAAARALGREGARLVLTARRRERLDALVSELRQMGSDGTIVLGDAREEQTAIDVAREGKRAFGRIDILV